MLHELPTEATLRHSGAGRAAAPDQRRALLYCHDTFGLGHLRRTLSVADTLVSHGLVDAQLVVTGSPVGLHFNLPASTDLVKLPAVVKVGDERYEARSLPVGFAQVRALRRELMLGAARTFRPDLVVIDHAPAGCGGEILPALQYLRRALPATRVVLGLRDVLDDPAHVRESWARDGVHQLLDELYDLIVVYGQRDVHNVIAEYGFSARAAAKTRFVGYLRRDAAAVSPDEIRTAHGLDGQRLVLVTAGGGGDGHEVFRVVLDAVRSGRAPSDVGWLLVGGPLMPREMQDELRDAAAVLPNVRAVAFVDDLPGYLRGVDLAIGMAGYNTVCEILSAGCRSIVVPRVRPRAEQLIRAEALAGRGMLRSIAPDRLDAPRLLREVESALDAPAPRPRPRLDGLERMAAEMRPLLRSPFDARTSERAHAAPTAFRAAAHAVSA